VRRGPVAALEGAIRLHDEKRSAFGIPASVRSCSEHLHKAGDNGGIAKNGRPIVEKRPFVGGHRG